MASQARGASGAGNRGSFISTPKAESDVHLDDIDEDDEDTCRTCGGPDASGDDAGDGECPSCADLSYVIEEGELEDFAGRDLGFDPEFFAGSFTPAAYRRALEHSKGVPEEDRRDELASAAVRAYRQRASEVGVAVGPRSFGQELLALPEDLASAVEERFGGSAEAAAEGGWPDYRDAADHSDVQLRVKEWAEALEGQRGEAGADTTTFETVEVDEGHETGTGRAKVTSSLMPGVGIGVGRRGSTVRRSR